MSELADRAVSLHQAGANCSQAVVAAGAGEFGLDQATAMALGAGFGGGMRKGEVCGAVTGALMLLGLKHGARSAEDQEQKKVANEKTLAFMTEFQKRHGSYLCREILKTHGKKICDQMVAGAMELWEEMDKKQS